LPPYIERAADDEDDSRYQTVYAKYQGAVAAPTAGLHFTDELLGRLKAKGVETAEVTLHVGAGAFQPVRVDKIEEHKMHSECFDVPAEPVAAVEAAKARGIDIVLADTAGRLPTQLHLMEEIKKVKRVLQKAMPDAPHEIIVVLDANIGQNAVNQVKAFDEALGLTGLIVTKLDGTAKGGILAALASDRPVPVRYIGVGEGIDDLRPFNAKAFVDALLD